MSPRALLALCGTVVLAAGIVGGRPWVSSHVFEAFAAPISASQPTPVSVDAATVDAPQAAMRGGDGSDVAIVVGVGSADSHVTPPTETAPEQTAAGTKPAPLEGDEKQAASSVEALDQCAAAQTCIDQFLWSLYQRAPKVDTIRVPEQIEVKVKKKGKTLVLTKTVSKLVVEDFTWKDPKAAEKAGMSPIDYVIGGMDRNFKLRLYHALHAVDDAGLLPGITSGFRDDYRQSLASGNKAAVDNSYHGGSRHGGYGHGLAVDLVSVKGETRSERLSSSETLWKWIDAHGKEFGIGRPYLNKDPPHVGPIDGKEYADHRGTANAQLAVLETNKAHRVAAHDDHKTRKRAGAPRFSRVRSI